MTQAQNLKAFQIYDKHQHAVSFSQMAVALNQYDVVLFGEFHDVSILHWLQLKTAQRLFELNQENLVLGAEMFERDNQAAINQYLHGEIDAKQFNTDVRLWNNYKTDYKPLLDFAKEKKLLFIATNVPRRYASLVAKNGIDTLKNLPKEEKQYFVQLPFVVDLKTPGYAEMLEMMQLHASDQGMNFVAAQALKDATMAESILEHFKKKQLFLHFNGDYHSKEYGGIYWYLSAQKKRLKIAVISTVLSEDAHLALPSDFVTTEFTIVVPADMTRTF